MLLSRGNPMVQGAARARRRARAAESARATLFGLRGLAVPATSRPGSFRRLRRPHAARATGKEKIDASRRQDGLFTVWTRGLWRDQVDRTELISIISRTANPFEDWHGFLACAEQRSIDIVISNTTNWH